MSTLAALPERYALMACATRAGSAREAGQDDRCRFWTAAADVMRRSFSRALDLEEAA